MHFTMMLRLLLLLVAHLTLCKGAGEDHEEQEFVGWHGDTFDAKSAFGEAYSGPVKISDKPLAFVWKNFISKQEAKHIATLAAPRLKQSTVGEYKKSTKTRSSYGMFIPRYQDATMAAIAERVQEWTGVPTVHQEDMQVLRYSAGQEYIKHMDAHGRMATLLIYLTDTTEGGETAFPATTDADWVDIALKPEGLSPGCAEGHVAVKPEVGMGLLFYSMGPDAHKDESKRGIDPKSLHTGCPPANGQIKWTATVWIHDDPFRPERFSATFPKRAMPDMADCVDLDHHCVLWRMNGLCEANKTMMQGGDGMPGSCEKSCGTCVKCDKDDRECRLANRERSGFIRDLEPELAQLFPFDE